MLLRFLLCTVLAGSVYAQRVHLVGEARKLEDRIRLTPALPQTSGAAWFEPKQPVLRGFDASFQFQISRPGGLGNGADGFAFVLQNQGFNALAGRGSAGGFALGDGMRNREAPGIPHSIAVFFDTYRNDDGNDPSGNYVAVCTNGAIGRMRWPPSRLGVGNRLKVKLKDGRVHTARIRYRPPMMSVSLDGGEPEVRVPVDLSTVVDDKGFAFVGVTASTGSGYEDHDILTWQFTAEDVSSTVTSVESDIRYLMSGCLEGRNLCTPPKAVVEAAGPDRYHVVLPAHLEWGASVPAAKRLRVVTSNLKGTVCIKVEDQLECSGPDGLTAAASRTAHLLAPDSPAGALIFKADKNSVYFSVNGPRGRDAAQSQGFFEFDVHIE